MNTAPSTPAGQAAFDGLRPDGTLLFLGYSPEPLSVPVQSLVMGRKRVMGMPSGSPHDMRDTLAFAAANGIVPEVTRVTLDDAPDVLAAMDAGTASGRSVIEF